MADYNARDFTGSGVKIAALAVDDPVRAEAMRRQLGLKFTVLCDPGRTVVTAWGLLNKWERGGIAYPAVFVLGDDRTVRYRSLDRLASRVDAGAVLAFVQGGMQAGAAAPRRRGIWPGLAMFVAAVRNSLRHGARTPRP